MKCIFCTWQFPLFITYLPIYICNDAPSATLEEFFGDGSADAHGSPRHDAALFVEIHRSLLLIAS